MYCGSHIQSKVFVWVHRESQNYLSSQHVGGRASKSNRMWVWCREREKRKEESATAGDGMQPRTHGDREASMGYRVRLSPSGQRRSGSMPLHVPWPFLPVR